MLWRAFCRSATAAFLGSSSSLDDPAEARASSVATENLFISVFPDTRFISVAPDIRFISVAPDSRFKSVAPDIRIISEVPDILPGIWLTESRYEIQ